jgi:hypothetical protein
MSSFRNIDAEDRSEEQDDQTPSDGVSRFIDTGADTGPIPRPTATRSARISRLSSVLDGQNDPGSNSAQTLLGQSENVEQLTSDLTVFDEPTPVEPEAIKKLFRFFSRK